ncbi:TIR domain-containing adapter molecule 1 isoform X1 [Columba livia]|uniref:TIR domain-containing adapter molecule 1 isoform X1 n=2 Tax=Columba livia TaxID=8932 RepID=UPI0031BAB328
MAQSTELQPNVEDVFNFLSQMPEDKVLSKASTEAQGVTLNSIPAEEQENHSSAISSGPGDEFQMLRSHGDVGFLPTASPNYAVRSSPVQIGGNSVVSGPRTLHSSGSPSLSSCFEVSASPTVAFDTQERVPLPSRLCEGSTGAAGQPDGDRRSHGLQETSWASGPNSHPGQDTGAQVPQPEEVLQVSSRRPNLPVPEMQVPTPGAVNHPEESSDVSSTVAAELHVPKECTDKTQDGNESSTGLPDLRAIVDPGPPHTSMGDSYVPAGTFNSTSAAISTCSLPPPTYSSSSTLASPLRRAPSNFSCPAPLHTSPCPAWPPPQTVEPMPTSEPDSGEFFSFVVLHASEDELVARRVKNVLEEMGVPNGAMLCEDFSIAGRSRITCFQDALENSAFTILLLTKNFQCSLCMFQTDTALMESILNPSKRDSVIPFVPKENPLERSQIPSVLGTLTPLDENSPMFSRTVHNTFKPSRIKQRKDMWDLMQRRKLQLYKEQTLQKLAALNLGSLPQVPPSATQPGLLEQSPHQWGPPTGHPTPAPVGPSPFQPLQLPWGHYTMTAGAGVPPLIIQHARMVQIGDHNVMQVETVAAGAQDREGDTTGAAGQPRPDTQS